MGNRASKTIGPTGTCQICDRSLPLGDLIGGGAVRSAVAARIRSDHPEFDASLYICQDCNARYRADYVRSLLEEDRGELPAVQSIL